ncbi:MAG: telomere binding protein [Claussenomyces sp. TS43310]|nr:MAG: telomere binding protein [Claussenomyces sp. TS43310]
MEGLLTPVSTAYKSKTAAEDDALVEVQTPVPAPSSGLIHVSAPEQALEVLRSKPPLDDLRVTLSFLAEPISSDTSNFCIKRPGPLTAQLVHALIVDIIPSHWGILNERGSSKGKAHFKYARDRRCLLSCIRSITGLNAILARLKASIQTMKEAKSKQKVSSSVEILKEYLNALSALLHGDAVIELLWTDLSLNSPPKRKAIWSEIITLIGRGKLLHVAAEASSLVNENSPDLFKEPWVADGMLYCRWVASNITQWLKGCDMASEGLLTGMAALLGKSLRLGYAGRSFINNLSDYDADNSIDVVLEEILILVLGSDDDRLRFSALLNTMAAFDQRAVLDGALRALAKKVTSGIPPTSGSEWWKLDSDMVAAAARYLDFVIDERSACKEHIISWLTSSSGAGVGEGVGIRRAVLAVLSRSRYDLEHVLEKTLEQFGDQLYIRHSPILQQEVHTQILLLSAGYVCRTSSLKLKNITKSGLYLNAVSNRLAASSTRCRLLGMIVGEVLSSLVDKPDKKMDFKIEELTTDDAKWYKSLVQIQDSVGSLSPLEIGAHVKPRIKTKPPAKQPSLKPTSLQGPSRIIAIEEVDNDLGESEEDDLVPYEKPDSDAEDSEEDATLVQRNKPTAPVYIRDLITYLRDTENYDRQKLALSTSPSLIRRKTSFGTEVSAHAEELAKLFVGLQDKYDLDNFQDMRLQGMIAVILCKPLEMAPWFAKTFFDGDYSMSQRSSILTALSISARELAGYKETDTALTTVTPTPSDAFPSRKLPPKMHKIYATELQQHGAIDALSTQLSNTMIQPLAASAADAATGPNILKVRTFSSRLAVEARRKPATVNGLSAIAASSFFFPLTGRFDAHLRAYGAGNVVFAPMLLTSFLKTLALILHASGPHTLQLPEMTSEFWDLLLAVRSQAQKERTIGQAILFGFMTILEVNENQRRLVEAQGKELTETQRWVDVYFQSLLSGSEEDDKVKALAAGILVKIGEVVEKYQALLIGDMSSF